MPVGGEEKYGRGFTIILYFIAVLGLFQHLEGQAGGYKFYKNYTPRDYDAQDQNRCIVQDNRGIIYVGNNGGVLSYDGVSWRLIKIPNDTVYSLAVGPGGTVFVGGYGEIGCLVPDATGIMIYNSLLPMVPADRRDFFKVYRIHRIGGGVCFRSNRHLIFYKDGGIGMVLKPKDGEFNGSYQCNGKLYVRIKGAGLREMKNGSFFTVPGGGFFSQIKISMMEPYGKNGAILIGTRKNGFYTYDGSDIKPLETEICDALKKNDMYYGTRLKNGEFALVTRQGGLFVMDAGGRLKYRFDEDSGLQDNGGWNVLQDNQHNLWLALDKGVTKIEYSSPFTIFDKQSGLPGSIRSAVRHGPVNVLYVGTNKGLFSTSPGQGKFHRVQDIRDSCSDLLSCGESLLAATNKETIQVKDGSEKIPVIREGSNVLEQSKMDRKRVWVGTINGLQSLYLSGDGRWQFEQKYPGIEKGILTIVEDKQRKILWMGLRGKGVIKAKLTPAGELDMTDVTHYGQRGGVPSSRTRIFEAADHVVFATDMGLYYYDEQGNKFLPDFLLGEDFSGGPGKRGVYLMAEDDVCDLWIHCERRNIHAIPREDGTVAFITRPFLRIPGIQVNMILPEPDKKSVWFGSDEGLVCYDARIEKEYRVKHKPLIRKVMANQRSFFDVCHRQGKDSPPIIEYKYRNLHFEFAAPFFEGELYTLHQCWLEGYEENRSPWSKLPQRDYTNLDDGVYTFHVKSRNVYGVESEEAVFRFKVLPPWTRTWWAFLVYTIMALVAVFFFIRWRTGKLEREKQHLEHEVEERTQEVQEKHRQLMEQAEKLKEMDKVKSRFFANISHEFRTPLTLIMGPLESMLASDGDPGQRKALKRMLRNSQRLLALINQLLALSRFDSGKMKLRVCRQNIIPFIKGLVASFEPVADKKDLLLSFRSQRDDITLYFDTEKLETVILNLLSNAVKFTPPGGRITVTARQANPGEDDDSFPEGSLELTVSDTGPGISREQIGHIFELFYMADSTFECNRQGAGIGLAIAKEMIELHHGKTEVHSHKGEGTEFVVRLPLGHGHLVPDEIAQCPGTQPIRKTPPGEENEEPDITGDSGPMAILTEEGSEPEENLLNAADFLEPGKEIILVVDDSADIRDYIRGAIEADYIVMEAKNGREGIEKAMTIIPDLIISDIKMPEVNGYQLCRALKNDIKTSHVPIILLTARASEDSISTGLETGADDYVTKPFSTRILGVRIKNLIDLRRHLQKTLRREMTMQPVKIAASQLDRDFIKGLRHVINRNMSDPDFNTEMLRKKMDMSQPTLYRKIKALTGESPTNFILSCRLTRGAQLLKKGFTVLEVALEAGFSSANYFTRCFKKKFGMLPSTYRASAG